jgi:hypothetical protein
MDATAAGRHLCCGPNAEVKCRRYRLSIGSIVLYRDAERTLSPLVAM